MRSTLMIVFAVLSLQSRTLEAGPTDSLAGREGEMAVLAKEVASGFNYYDEISASAPNLVKADNEIGGQCGDYALEFVNRWNRKYPGEALLLIQQQGIPQFPDGLYEVVGKDTQPLPFLKNRKTSMLYLWNNILGVGHPETGGYKIKLRKAVHVTSHFGLPRWETNGPHVWVAIGETSVDPTYADLGALPVVGEDQFRATQ